MEQIELMTKSENDTKNINTVRWPSPSQISLFAKYFHFLCTVHGKIQNMESHITSKNALLTTLRFTLVYAPLNKLVGIKITEYLVGAYFICITTLIQKRISGGL